MKQKKQIIIPFISKVGALDRLMFTKHMYIMIKSGVPISETLETLAKNTKSAPLKKVLFQIYDDVQNGKSLYSAFERFPKVFDQFYTSLIRVSEDSGTLEETLDFLAIQLEKDYELKQKIKGAMFYPVIILVMGGGIAAFISIVILPQFVGFFDALEVELPLSTKLLLGFANIMQSHGILIIIGFIVFLFLLKIFLNSKKVEPTWSKVQLKLPVAGKLIRYNQLTRMCRNFATLLQSGVPAASALHTTAETMTNYTFKKDLFEIEDSLVQGKNISDAIDAGHYTEIPPIVSKMIRVGERTGNLEEVLTYMSEFYESEIDNITKNMSTIIEPILLVAIGLMVGFIAIAIIGPIYKLTGSIK